MRPLAKLNRRHFLSALGGSALGAGAYAKWVEPGWLATRREQFTLGNDSSVPPVTLVQLSDFHASEEVSLKFIRRAVDAAIAQRPDVICLTGDFVTGQYRELDGLAEVLSPLARTAPTFATLGNHDGGAWATACHHGYKSTTEVSRVLESSGITLLNNACETLQLRGREFRFVGLPDVWAGGFQPSKCLTGKAAPAPTVVLSHNPDTKDALHGFSWQLLLAGHTHGGQMRVPLIGAPFAPVRDKRFLSGLHRWEGRWLHISTGVGNLHGVRFGCRPEINVLTLS